MRAENRELRIAFIVTLNFQLSTLNLKYIKLLRLYLVQSLNAYLFRMTRNAVLDICKHSRIRMQFENSARVDGQILCDDVTERIDTAELSRQIEAAVSKMPARRYEIYRLSRECGKNNREIAEELNISPKSVENQITKALGSIKKEIS